jgi:hypothetical protein
MTKWVMAGHLPVVTPPPYPPGLASLPVPLQSGQALWSGILPVPLQRGQSGGAGGIG